MAVLEEEEGEEKGQHRAKLEYGRASGLGVTNHTLQWLQTPQIALVGEKPKSSVQGSWEPGRELDLRRRPGEAGGLGPLCTFP